MAATETIPVPLEYQAPDFQLEDALSGKLFSLGEPVNPHQKPSIGCGIKWKDPALRES